MAESVRNLSILGRWVWNDFTNTLEYLGLNPVSDRQGAKKKDKWEIKPETRSAGAGGVRSVSSKTKSRWQPIVPTADHTTVTLDDVKIVACYMMLEVEEIPESFDILLQTEQFDMLLLFMINYFHWYFAMREKETYTNPVHIEPSLEERELYEELCIKAVPLSPSFVYSSGQALYSYCTFLIWITFKRQHHDVIQKEVNRLLRTDTFNPAIRAKPSPAPEDDEAADETPLTPAQYRRSLLTRPSLKLLVDQRSAPLISILPQPHELSVHLFERLSEQKARKKMLREIAAEQCPRHNVDVSELKLGIIGEPLSLFDPLTLTSLEPDEETEEEADESRPSSTTQARLSSTVHSRVSSVVQAPMLSADQATNERQSIDVTSGPAPTTE